MKNKFIVNLTLGILSVAFFCGSQATSAEEVNTTLYEKQVLPYEVPVSLYDASINKNTSKGNIIVEELEVKRSDFNEFTTERVNPNNSSSPLFFKYKFDIHAKGKITEVNPSGANSWFYYLELDNRNAYEYLNVIIEDKDVAEDGSFDVNTVWYTNTTMEDYFIYFAQYTTY